MGREIDFGPAALLTAVLLVSVGTNALLIQPVLTSFLGANDSPKTRNVDTHALKSDGSHQVGFTFKSSQESYWQPIRVKATRRTATANMPGEVNLVVRDESGTLSCASMDEAPGEGDLMTFYLNIENIGNSSANDVLVEFYLDGTLYASYRQSFEASSTYNDIRTKDHPWYAIGGNHLARWVTNPDRSIQETTYTDNECEYHFFVGPNKLYFFALGDAFLGLAIAIFVIAITRRWGHKTLPYRASVSSREPKSELSR